LLARPERIPFRATGAFTEAIGRWAAKSTPIVVTRLVLSPSAVLDPIAATERPAEFGAWSASNSTGGMSPSELCSRSWFYADVRVMPMWVGIALWALVIGWLRSA